MAEPTPEQLQGQLSLLLEEYRALHEDINGRIAAQMTLLGFAAASLALFVGTKDAPGWVYATVGGLGAVVVVGVYLSNNYWLHRAGDRVAEIERDANDLARRAYALAPEAALLRWQSDVNVLRGPVRDALRVLSGARDRADPRRD